MKASVIISVYKNVDALRLVLDSLRCQTEKDFEIIISEDGNSDVMSDFVKSYDWFCIHQHITQEEFEAQKKREQAIQEFKAKEVVCPKCGQVITDLASAMADKTSGSPIHFECVMSELEKSETVGRNEKIAYIGQGRFGILYFENPRDQRHFTIKKIIDWESREQKSEWRQEMSGLYSHIE